MDTKQPYAIEMRNITKRFPGIIANDNITLGLRRGEIHALLGENGAGKSTLLKIINGDYQMTEGEIVLNGEVQHFHTPKDAIDAGISVIYLERQIVPCMTVAENMYLGAWLQKKDKFIDYRVMEKKAEEDTR